MGAAAGVWQLAEKWELLLLKSVQIFNQFVKKNTFLTALQVPTGPWNPWKFVYKNREMTNVKVFEIWPK